MASTSPLAAARCNRGRAEERSGGGTDGRCGSDTRPRCHGIESGGRPSSRLVWQHAETTRTHRIGHPANCAATSIRVRRLGHHRLQGSPGSRIRALPQGIWMAAARVTDVGGFGHTSCATPPSITSPRRTAGMNSSPTSNGAPRVPTSNRHPQRGIQVARCTTLMTVRTPPIAVRTIDQYLNGTKNKVDRGCICTGCWKCVWTVPSARARG
jgi:hypothetical protein